MKEWYKSKTILVGIGVIVIGAAQSIVQLIPMGTEAQGYVLMGLGAIMAGLRAVTSTGIGTGS